MPMPLQADGLDNGHVPALDPATLTRPFLKHLHNWGKHFSPNCLVPLFSHSLPGLCVDGCHWHGKVLVDRVAGGVVGASDCAWVPPGRHRSHETLSSQEKEQASRPESSATERHYQQPSSSAMRTS